MQRPKAYLAALSLLALLAGFAAGVVAATAWFEGRRHLAARSEAEPLEPGKPRADALDLPRVRERTFSLVVPERAVALCVRLTTRGTELSLSARRGDGADSDPGSDLSVATEAGEASLSIGRFSDPPLGAGRWNLRVAWTSDVLPTTPERRLVKIPFAIEAGIHEARVDGDLVPGIPVESGIDAGSGGFRSFRIEVPPGSPALRFDLSDVASDLDLYARRGGPVLTLGEDVHFAKHLYGCETLLVGGAGAQVEPGTWYVDVVDVLDQDGVSPFRIQASLSPDPPRELLEIPALQDPRGVASRASQSIAAALPAVVEIETDDAMGSGTILTADGWILTNAHVVARLGGGSFEEVVVSASLDPMHPPVELFRGRVDRVDEERDLALVRVVSGFYGQPLPAGYVFPALEMGDPGKLSIGDPIWLLGYPSTGGRGSRVTVTCTRGVVSGYETVDFGLVIKTDAEITSGNSGGAALDERGRLIGVPTSLVELGSGQVAYVHPSSALPEEWRALLRAR